MNPTGHAALYFDRICAAGPTRLRLCRPGEPGAVLSRYHNIAGYDWLAIPVIPYLYAVDDPAQIPSTATPETEALLRDAYRRVYLRGLAPDTPAGLAPDGEWIQLVGSAYDRTIHGFTIRSTPAQDARVIALFNDRANISHFNLFFNNCADLARTTLNFYYPHLIHRNLVADVGFTTPKQAAKLIVHYGKKHPDANLRTFLIPQVPGTIDRSTKVRGVLESLVKSKRYVVPLAYLLPQTTAGMAVAYLGGGRFRFPTDGDVWTPDVWTSNTHPQEGSSSAETADVTTPSLADGDAATRLMPAAADSASTPTATDSETVLVSAHPLPAN